MRETDEALQTGGLVQSVDYTGEWWLPQDPGQRVAGVLHFTGSDAPRLMLIGSFRDSSTMGQAFRTPIILGETDRASQVTLYGCLETRTTLGTLYTAEFVAEAILEGHHFETRESVAFRSLSVSYDNLIDWTGVSGLRTTVERLENGLRLGSSYQAPADFAVHVSGRTIRLEHHFTASGSRTGRLLWEQQSFVEVEPQDPTTLERLLADTFYHIRNFISLGVGKPVRERAVQGEVGGTQNEERVRVKVYYPVVGGESESGTIHPGNMLFSLRDIAESYEGCLAAWFQKAETLRPVYDLYFATLFSPSMFLETHFLNLAQAAESYHRRTRATALMPAGPFAEVLSMLRATLAQSGLSKELHDALSAKLQYLNEPALRRRLEELLKELTDLATTFIPNQVTFARSVADTRNYHTHYSPELEAKAARGSQMLTLVEQLTFLLQACFLVEMGLPRDKIAALLDRNQRIAYFRTRFQS